MCGTDLVTVTVTVKFRSVAPLGICLVERPYTGRNTHRTEALEAAKSGAGKRIMEGKIKDALFPEGNAYQNGENLVTGAKFGFKFK